MQDENKTYPRYIRHHIVKFCLQSKVARILNLSFLLFVILSVLSSCSKEPQKQPNIVFLLADDMRWDGIEAAGNAIIKTPEIDNLARSGVYFKNAFVTTSICCSSRASILSGQYMSRHKIEDFITSFSDQALSNTYPLLLKQDGYRIGFVGKYGVGHPKDHPANLFDFWECTDKHQPDYENFDSLGHFTHYTDIVDQSIQDFIESSDQRPFCLSVSFKSPHSQDGDPRQFIPKEKFKHLYADQEVPKPKTAEEQYWDKLPSFMKEDQSISRKRWKLRFETDSLYQQSVKNYFRLINGIDEVVGNLRSALAKKGLSENTVIIFTSDNGFYLGEHGLAGKWFGHNESIRVPLIIYDPRNEHTNKPASTLSATALNIDIAPTVLGLANVSVPVEMQGIDLLASIRENQPARSGFYYEHVLNGSPSIPKTYGYVTDTLKYLFYPEHKYEELFDTKNDPLEITNLAEFTNQKEKLKLMRELFSNKQKQVQ